MQLYRVSCKGILKDGTHTDVVYLAIGNSQDDVRSRLSYTIDLSLYSRFEVKKVKREKGNVYMICSAEKKVEEVGIDEDGHSVDCQYQVTITGSIIADNEDRAFRRIGKYLQSFGTGVERECPLHDETIRAVQI